MPNHLISQNNSVATSSRRCTALLSNCKGSFPDGTPCDYSFTKGNLTYPAQPKATVCPNCGTPRERCSLPALEGSDRCAFHRRRGKKSLYNQTILAISDDILDELEDEDNKSLAREYHLARLVVDKMARSEADPKELLLAIEKIFKIAESRKKIEENYSNASGLDAEATNLVRKRIKVVIDAYNEAIKQFVHDEQTRVLITQFVRKVLKGGLDNSD